MGQETYQLRYLQGAGGGGLDPSGDDLTALYIVGGVMIFVAVVAFMVRGAPVHLSIPATRIAEKTSKISWSVFVMKGHRML
mmetsp:Transcript_36506/g.58834  ORF Transcript_36506/g.58834 Transcript_36506/m.58834 type:complete len:81 (-) Transcript_36506:138-380(-)